MSRNETHVLEIAASMKEFLDASKQKLLLPIQENSSL